MQTLDKRGKVQRSKAQLIKQYGCIATLSFIAILMLMVPAYSQEFRGTISGTVTDSTGAIVPGTIVTATGPQLTYKAVTGSNGQFLIPFVQPATYTVKIAHNGFKTEERTNVIIDISTRFNLKSF